MPAAPPSPTAAELGLMVGAPPPADRVVTLANWQDPPFNRWGFGHVRELIPTGRIDRAPRPRALPPAARPLDGVRFRWQGRDWDVDGMLAATETDGFMVVHAGGVVAERYGNGLAPHGTHLLMSVSKSIVATVAGILDARGTLPADAPVTAILPELAGTSWEGATIRHLLDMRTGTRFDEDYANPRADVRVYEQVYGWRPRTDADLPPDGPTYIRGLPNAGAHGGPFDYRSILTDVLGWAMERAAGTRLPELLARELWGPMGAEHDAEVTVGPRGDYLADGGICATLRDLARFGLLWLDGGVVEGRRVVPAAWIDDTIAGAPDGREAFAASRHAGGIRGGHYRSKWWVLEPDVPVYAGFGINGQMVLVDVPHRLVVAKLSTWPAATDDDRLGLTLAGVRAIARALA